MDEEPIEEEPLKESRPVSPIQIYPVKSPEPEPEARVPEAREANDAWLMAHLMPEIQAQASDRDSPIKEMA